MRLAACLLTTSVIVAAPAAEAQSIADTFRQLKNSVRQLGGAKPQARPSAADTAATDIAATDTIVATPGVATAEEDGQDLFPAVAFSEDRSDTALEARPVVARRPDTFDIRGFRLGMSAREAFRVANKAGFRRRAFDGYGTTGSFELEATRIANYQLNRPISDRSKSHVSYTAGSTRDGARVLLNFTLEPGGPRLSRIEYSAKADGMTKEQFFAAVTRKYGPADLDGDTTRTWQSGSKKFLAPNDTAVMIVLFMGSNVSFTLRQSTAYDERSKQAIAARAQQIASARGGGVKF